MALGQVKQQLKSLGSEQTRQIYLRHGVSPPVYGVKWGDMRKLARSLGTDQTLAMQLWRSGVHECRLVGLMIADPEAATRADLEAMAADIDNYVEIDEFAKYVAASGHLDELADDWVTSSDEWISACGWTLVAQQALSEGGAANPYFLGRLAEIEERIDTSPNRTRHTMNGAVIAIGSRNATLRKRATAAARRIGKVEVDHGDTSCVTPEAIGYIDRMWARRG